MTSIAGRSTFWIQRCAPRSLLVEDVDALELIEALERSFPMETESAVLCWNWVCVPLSYKYEVGEILDTALPFLEALMASTQGQREVHWWGQSFNAAWQVGWGQGRIEIVAAWSAVFGQLESVLNSRPRVEMPLEDFLREWHGLLGAAEDALALSGSIIVRSKIARTRERLPGPIDGARSVP